MLDVEVENVALSDEVSTLKAKLVRAIYAPPPHDTHIRLR
jgi:hypothetical protein